MPLRDALHFRSVPRIQPVFGVQLLGFLALRVLHSGLQHAAELAESALHIADLAAQSGVLQFDLSAHNVPLLNMGEAAGLCDGSHLRTALCRRRLREWERI